MAAIRPCTGTTADWKAVEDTLILPNLSAKLQRERSIRYKEVMELADVLGYDLVWKRRER